MDRVDARFGDSFQREFERVTAADDRSAADAILADGAAIPILRADTPPGHVVRVRPDGREELVRVDRDAAASILGA